MNPTNTPTNTPPEPGAPGLASETWVSTKLPDDQLRRAFRTYAAALSDAHTLPPAAAILFRAERRRRRLAIQRAERPLLIMQTLGTFSAIAAAAWLLYRFAPRTLPTLNTTTLALTVACTALVLAGCWAMLHASSRPSA
jgi:peptidoglycan biosynthesis protein MviN/MurJ (putative lipid II flippase)